MAKNLDVEAFIQKAVLRKEQMSSTFDLNTKNYGTVTFNRPKNQALLKYLDLMASAVVTEGEGKATKIIEQDFNLMLDASKELIYNCCPMMQSKELQAALDIQDPIETPVEVFGISQTMELAASIVEKSDGEKIQTQAAEKIKN